MPIGWLAVDLGPGVVAGFTSRLGGVSREPFAELNLGRSTGDRLADVAANRARVEAAVGMPVAYAEQVHGIDCRWIEQAGETVRADALAVDRPGLAVAIQVADCRPVLLADPQAQVAAAVHVGRRGLLDGVLQAAIAALSERGAAPERMTAAIGPGICGGCYEVPPEMAAAAGQRLPAVISRTSWETAGIDIQAGIVQILAECQIPRVETCHICTYENGSYYSFRAQKGTTGRFAGIVGLYE